MKDFLSCSLVLVLCLFVVFSIVGTIAVRFDKDISRISTKFEEEVRNVVPYNYETGKEIMSAKDMDEAYCGKLDNLIKRRDKLLQEKGVVLIGNWTAAVKAGFMEPIMSAIYLPLKPWRLRYR